MTVVALQDAHEVARFGGKCVSLGRALRAGLPVPPGCAVSVQALSAIARGDAVVTSQVLQATAHLRAPLAARSSAVGEDGAAASFAGQHASYLNVHADGLVAALRDVYASAHSEAALAYRKKQGIAGEIEIAAVVQELVDSSCAGVLFTRNPVTGADEHVIEAAWGLGEGVVAGLVTPDHYRLARDGHVVERRAGDKDVAIRRAADGGTYEEEVGGALVDALCLDDTWLARLSELAERCEQCFGPAIDLEWAIVGDALYLLQARPISTGKS